MKFFTIPFAILCSTTILASSTIEIQPGSRIKVEAGEEIQVLCVAGSGQTEGESIKVASCIRNCGNTQYFSNVVLQIKKVMSSGKEVSTCAEMPSESDCNQAAFKINTGL